VRSCLQCRGALYEDLKTRTTVHPQGFLPGLFPTAPTPTLFLLRHRSNVSLTWERGQLGGQAASRSSARQETPHRPSKGKQVGGLVLGRTPKIL
jgi:hypothetical protein